MNLTDYRHQRQSNPEMLGQQAFETLNTVLYSVSKWDGWMVSLYAILRPFQQYFSHIRTMGQMTMREFLQWNPVSCGARTRNRKISRSAHNPDEFIRIFYCNCTNFLGVLKFAIFAVSINAQTFILNNIMYLLRNNRKV